MTKLLSLMKKPRVVKVLDVAVSNPKKGVDLSNKGVSFLDFSDWIRVAERALGVSPYAEFWRGLALQYPQKKDVRELNLFLKVIKSQPRLADQARAFLFSVPAKGLPIIKDLQKLAAETEEQERIKLALIQK